MKTKNIFTAMICLLLFHVQLNAQDWTLTGNAGTNPAVNYIGTSDNAALRIKTNNTIRINITSGGNVKIGSGTPASKLDVAGVITATGGTSDNWNSAFGWGNHALAGYLTSFTEVDPEIGVNINNYVPKWNGTAMVSGSIYQNGNFTGIGATSAIGAADFVVQDAASSGYGGMYVNMDGVSGCQPFYGYAVNDTALAWTYVSQATNNWHLYNSGIRLTVQNDGNVGIGTSAPAYPLQVSTATALRAGYFNNTFNSSSSTYGIYANNTSPGTGAGFGVYGASSGTGGTNYGLRGSATNGAINFGVYGAASGGTINYAGYFLGLGYFSDNLGIGTSVAPTVRLQIEGGTDSEPGSGGFIVTGDVSSINLSIDNNEIMARDNGAVAPLFLNNNGGNVSMCVASGNVTIGTATAATGYILSVDGKVMCEELRVQNSASWPDYVFNDNYELKSIDEFEKSIKENKHLPGMPSAKEIEGQKGFHVGEMQIKLLEKIEEQALYIIQLKKEIDEIKTAMIKNHNE